jgi:hypothetical protein
MSKPVKNGNRTYNNVYKHSDGTIVVWRSGGSINPVLLNKLGGLAQKVNNNMGEYLNVPYYEEGTDE